MQALEHINLPLSLKYLTFNSNNMKNKICIGLLSLALFSSCEKDKFDLGESVPAKPKEYNLKTAKAVDMVLIYSGGLNRPDWTETELNPYISYKDPDNQKSDWLFDGFLFLDFGDGAGRSFVAPVKEAIEKPGRKSDWEVVLNRQFASNKGIDALNKAVGKKAVELGAPLRKRKVVIGLPEPWPGQQDWGAINGNVLNFSSQSSRLEAVKWYVDQALAKWTALNPQHLELAGFYWVPESAYISQVILPTIKSYISSKGEYYFYHIPHWGAMLRDNWSKLGFDVAYQQPNVYIHSQRVVSVADVVTYGNERGLSFEVEFDQAVMSANNNADKRGRFLEYLDVYDSKGVFKNFPLTYYQAHFGWADLVKSTHPADLELSKRLARTIVERQKRADAN